MPAGPQTSSGHQPQPQHSEELGPPLDPCRAWGMQGTALCWSLTEGYEAVYDLCQVLAAELMVGWSLGAHLQRGECRERGRS
jgi:hypothetical protein